MSQPLTYRISGKPDYGFVEVDMPAETTLKVEASAMATMTPNIDMKTKLKGGFSRFLSGETLFINEFTAKREAGTIGIAPGPPGDLNHLYLNNQTVFLQNGAFLASTMGVDVASKWQGLMKGFFSGEGLFLVKCSGTGDLWFNTFGAILQIDVKDEYVVDNGYVVGFTEGLEYQVEAIPGFKSLLFSGEGLVSRFRGQGTLWIQTRQVPAFAAWVFPYRTVQSSSS